MAYSIIGRIIDAKHAPVAGLQVRAVAAAGVVGSDTALGETTSDDGGRFSLSIDPEKMGGGLAHLGRTPRVHLELRDRADAPVLTTRAQAIEWQLEFRIYLGGGTAAANAPDLYKAGIRRMVAESREARMGGAVKRTVAPGGKITVEGGWKRSLAVVQHSALVEDSANMMFGMMDGVAMDALESTPLKIIGYDGAQVPRRCWEAPDNQVIIWPRKEPFRWA